MYNRVTRHLFSALFLAAMVGLLPAVLSAQIVDKVVIRMTLPGAGNLPAVGLPVELFRPATSDSVVQITDSNGVATFMFVDEDLYDIKVSPKNAVSFPNNLTFKDTVEPIVVDYLLTTSGPPDFVPTQQFNIQLVLFPKIFTVRLYFAQSLNLQNIPDLSRPIEAADISTRFKNDPPGQMPDPRTKTDKNGIARFGVELTKAGDYFAKVMGQGLVSKFIEGTVPPGPLGGQTIAATLESDAIITVQLKDPDSGANYTLDDEFEADVVCDGFSGTQTYVFESIPDSDRLNGTIPIPAIANLDSYTCRGSFKDGGFGVEQVGFTDLTATASPQIFTANVYDADAEITYNFVNATTGASINDVRARVDIFSDDSSSSSISFDAHGLNPIGNTSITFDVISGNFYKTLIKLEGATPGALSGYLIAEKIPLTDVSTGGNIQVNIPLLPTSGTIAVTLVGTEGQAIIGGKASAFARVQSADGSSEQALFIDVPINSSGQANIPVVPDVTFEVRVAPPKNTPQEGGDFLLPASQFITAQANATTQASFALILPNYFIDVSFTIIDDNGDSLSISDAKSVRCRVKNSAGETSGSEMLEGDDTVFLVTRVANMSKSENIGVSCHAVFDTEGDGLDGELYGGRVTITSSGGETDKEVSLTLNSLGTFFEKQQKQFSPDQAQFIAFQDGRTTLRLGADALGSGTNAGISTETAEPNSSIDDISLTGWDITLELDDEEIEEPDQSIEMCYEPTAAELAEYGIELSSLVLKRYDPDTDTFIPTTTTVVGDTVCGDLDHFSAWYVMIEVAAALKDAAIDLKLKLKGKWGVFTWDVDSDTATGTEQYLVEYSIKAKNRKKCTKMDSFPKSELFTGNKGRIKVNGGKRSGKKICGRVSLYTASEDITYSSSKFKKARKK